MPVTYHGRTAAPGPGRRRLPLAPGLNDSHLAGSPACQWARLRRPGGLRPAVRRPRARPDTHSESRARRRRRRHWHSLRLAVTARLTFWINFGIGLVRVSEFGASPALAGSSRGGRSTGA